MIQINKTVKKEMKSTKQQKMYVRIENHGNKLIEFFKLERINPVDLCKKLRRIDLMVHRRSEDYCNGKIDETGFDAVCETAKKQLTNIFGADNMKRIFINSDPRGYALKIKADEGSDRSSFYYNDWGGYGIIAPDFSEGV